MTITQKKIDGDLLIQEKKLLDDQISLLQQKLISMQHYEDENRLLFDQLTIVQEELMSVNNKNIEYNLLLKSFCVLSKNTAFKMFFSESTWKELEKISMNCLKSDKEALYGASKRIQDGVTYQLGAAMIDNSKNFMGLISLPFVLRKIKKEWRYHERILIESFLPSIDCYADVNEALKCKQHLSYRLGYVIENSSDTIWGEIKTPFLLLCELIKFKKSKSKSKSK